MLLDVSRLIWRRWAGRFPTGIDRVCLAYLQHFSKDAQAVVQHRHYRRILDRPASEALFELLSAPSPAFRRDLVAGILRFGANGDSDGRGRPYLNIGHTGLDDDRFSRWVRHANVRPIYFVHDLIPLTHPEFCRAGESERHARRMTTVLTTGAAVIGNSQATLDSLAQFAQLQGTGCPPAIAAWLGCETSIAPQPGAKPPRAPTFVLLGTIEARKNHLMLLLVWRRMIERLGDEAPRLLVIGQRGWECEQVFDLLDRSTVLRDHVVEIDRCDDQSLANHLATARALLFPSLVEGFGLPLVEALDAGTAVIASDLPVFREIGGDIPDYLDPLDGPAWERAILSYAVQDSSAREQQLRRLSGYRHWTWEDHFAAVTPWLSQL